jgi:hypothetical protein
MVVNEKACSRDKRVDAQFIASRLAPTGGHALLASPIKLFALHRSL